VKRIVILPDTQLPFEDRRALKAVLKYIGDTQPDHIIHIGDLMDYPQPSRWTKGTAGEFEGSVFRDSEYAKKHFLAPLREIYQGPIGVHEGNHDERPRTYLSKYAPALAQSDTFNFNKLLDFDGFGITVLPEVNSVAPEWVTTHGHKGGIKLSSIGGGTALGAAKKFNKSVVMGHTHRLAVKSETGGYGGAINRYLTGLEVGHLMDMKQAHYLKGGTANWQMGFALLTVEGTHVKPEIVPIHKGKFTVDGDTWEV